MQAKVCFLISSVQMVIFFVKYIHTYAYTGIGRALCQHLLTAGAKVIAISKSVEKLEELKNICSTVETIPIDLKNWQNTREVLSKLPQIDGLVNNAGVAIIKPFAELTEQDFDEYNICVYSAYFLYFNINIFRKAHLTSTSRQFSTLPKHFCRSSKKVRV